MSNDVNETLYRLLEREQAKVLCHIEHGADFLPVMAEDTSNPAWDCAICGEPLGGERGRFSDPTIPSWLTVLLHGVTGEVAAMDGLMVQWDRRPSGEGFLHERCTGAGNCCWTSHAFDATDCHGTGYVPNPLFAELVEQGRERAACGFVEDLLKVSMFDVSYERQSDNRWWVSFDGFHQTEGGPTRLAAILDAVCNAAGVEVRS